MTITLYVQTYPVQNSPIAYSFVPFPPHQRHTFTRDGAVYDAVSGEVQVTVPDGSVVDAERRLLCWNGEKGRVKSKVSEVCALVQAEVSGFGKAS